MNVRVIGDGKFGKFLSTMFEHALDEDSDNIILAVPFMAYDEVASQHKGKHLINVCSVQRFTNEILKKHTGKVTGIHPLFGPRSFSPENNTCIFTHGCGPPSAYIMRLFLEANCNIHSMSAKAHDELMAKVHKPIIALAQQMEKLRKDAEDVPATLLPPSFKLVMDLLPKLSMSEGTTSSILCNSH